jgi:hypothetical protein
MGNALVRSQIHKVHVVANGDPDDAKLRKKLDKLGGAVVQRERDLKEAQQSGDPQKIKKAQQRLDKARADFKKAQQKDNVVTAVLAYPRSGESTIMAIRPMDLPAGATVDWSSKDFFEAAIFKETIQGETVLEVKIADKDKKSPFWLFIRGVLSAIFKSLASDAIEGISEVFVSKAADGISGKIEKVIKGGEKASVAVVAASGKARIEVGSSGQVQVPNATGGGDAPIQFETSTGILRLALTAPRDVTKTVKLTNVGGKMKQVKEILKKGEPNGFVELRLRSEPT